MGKKVLTTENLSTIKELNDELYQEKLEDGISIKTINGLSILGKGNIVVKASDGDASVTLLAPTWSASNWYNEGDIVIYNKKIYRCIYNHSSSNFGPGWAETTLAEAAAVASNIIASNTAYTVLNNNFNSKFDARFETKMDEYLNDLLNREM